MIANSGIFIFLKTYEQVLFKSEEDVNVNSEDDCFWFKFRTASIPKPQDGDFEVLFS